MKRIVRILLALIIVLGSSFAVFPVAEAREAFVINKHVVEMDVSEDGKISVTETMNVTFSELRHGIYVNIPKKYNMTWDINGTTINKSYLFPVRNVKGLSGQKASVDNDDSNYVQIRFGSANSYANTFETYKWSYDIITRDLDLDGLQMLFMNINGGGWNTEIQSLEFVINMPKSFDRDTLWFDSPVGVTNESRGPLTFVVSGNTISGSYNETLRPGQAVTIQLILDDNYFKFPNANTFGVIGVLASGILALAMATVFFLFGKDDPLIDTVEFHAPAGVNSAEVGVIIDGVANDGDVVSLILDWGRRGIITIEDTEDDLILRKRNPLEDNAREYEVFMFDKLFNGKDEVKVSSLKTKFYTTVQKTEEKLDKYFQSENRRLTTELSNVLQIVGVILSFLPMGIATFIMSYNYDYDGMMALIWVGIEAFCIIATTIIMVYMDDRKYMHKWYTKALLYTASVIMGAIACGVLLLTTATAGVNVLYAVAIILFTVAFIVSVRFMKKRTEYGNELLGQVVGLRNFILVAEQDRLEELVKENPFYFYDILPYAYALGLTDVWNEHFKNLTIEPCDWYYGPHYHSPYHMMNSLESQMNTIERAMTSVPESESSGGGSIGGGGGGFSGGGFGGSSGGSW